MIFVWLKYWEVLGRRVLVTDSSCNVCLKCCRYVYQKAYVEFFVSPEKLEGLEQRLQKQSSITYMAINSKGKVCSPTHPFCTHLALGHCA